jgi:gamma-glutamylcyclotransferase
MSDTVWYFAYGANMCPSVLARRGIEPLSSEAARLDDYKLVFDQACIPLIEPCFASVDPAPGVCVHGVLYALSPSVADQLDDFEGPMYGVIDVQVTGSISGVVTARAYRTRKPTSGLIPSRKYLNLVIKGAEAASLPETYVAALREQPNLHIPLLSRCSTFVFAWLDRPGLVTSFFRKAAHMIVALSQRFRGSR